MAEPWKLNGPGHTADTELCCCDNENCRPYFACCIRQFSAEFHGESFRESNDDPALCRVSRFTVENLCNSQESADWSWFNDWSGDGDIVFGGRFFQGCTYGIDISLEDLFCDCTFPGFPNFRWHATVCNPNDFSIVLVFRRPTFCFSFDGDEFCCLDQIGLQEIGPIVLAAGESYELTAEFKKADWDLCTGECYRNGPAAILMGSTYFDDGLDHTCLRPISCIGEIREFAFDGTEIANCEHSLCPECGCRLDLNCEVEECCGCGCDGFEAMNSCAPPKELCSGCTADFGSITLCYGTDQGLGLTGTFVMCVNDDCKVAAFVRRNIPSGTWTYSRAGDPGVSVNIPDSSVGEVNCQDVIITWEINAVEATLTVDGTSASTPLPPGYNPLLPAGQCYVVARHGRTFTLKS